MKIVLSSVVLALALPAMGQGSVEALMDFNSSIAGFEQGTIGFAFQANQDINVTHLGAFTNVIIGDPVAVGIWSSSGALLGTASVSTTNVLVGQSRYVELSSPISLTALQVYTIGAFLPQVTGVNIAGGASGGSVFVPPALQVIGYATNSLGTLAQPFQVEGGAGVVPATANFIYPGIVPEPAAATLILAGVAAMAFYRRNRI